MASRVSPTGERPIASSGRKPKAPLKGRWISRWVPHRVKQRMKWEMQAASAAFRPVKHSYSQHGEDAIVQRLVGSSANPSTHCYVDVGANHPTHISNTYLFYRNGFSGVLIEPTITFAPLYKMYRKRDIYVAIGCCQTPGLLPLYEQAGSVMNSFESAREAVSRKTSYVPVFPLDSILPLLGGKRIMLLSVDCEGFDLEVLLSGAELLKESENVIVECGDHVSAIARVLDAAKFSLVAETKHNQIWNR